MVNTNLTRSKLASSLLLLPVFFMYLFYPNATQAGWNHKNVLSSSECSECHEEAVDVWKKTDHQKNFKALSKNKDAKTIAKKLGISRIKSDKSMCASCHYTVGFKGNKARIVAGVSCESCHTPSKEWVNIHNDFGGKGINKKNESASHKKNRFNKLEQLGMIRPSNTYGWAKNCLNCHIVANEKLVNIGGHKAGSDFKLSKRTQGDIKHYPKADIDTLRYYNLVSYATELEVSFRALVNASGGKYASEMKKRANAALANLKKANSSTPNQYAKNIISSASKAKIKAKNKGLTATANSISINIMRMVQQKTGYKYSSSKLKKSPIAKKPASPKPSPSKIKAKPKTKSPVKKRSTPKKATPVVKPATVKPSVIKKAAPVISPTQIIQPDVDNNTRTSDSSSPLIEAFDITIPGNVALCQTYTPWVLGRIKVNVKTVIPTTGCYSISIKAGRTGQVYLFSETRENKLVQLVPNKCNYFGITFNALSAHKTLTLPKSDYKNSAIMLDKPPVFKKFFAVVTDSADSNSKMTQLSENITSVCDISQQQKAPNSTDGFDNNLEVIKKLSDGHMDWRAQKINLR